MKKRVYLAGNDISTTYRARALLEYLASSSNYAFSYSDRRYLLPAKQGILGRISFKGLRILDRLYRLWMLCHSDVVYVLPMSKLFGYEKFIIKSLSKKVISEFYISLYDSYVNDRKTVKEGTADAIKLMAQDRSSLDISDVIIFLNNAEKNYYLEVVGKECNDKDVHLIPLCTPSKKLARLPFANGMRDELVLCWWGTFIPLHGLDKIIESAKILKNMNVNFKMYLFGTSSILSQPYFEYILKEDLSDCVFIDNSKSFSDFSLEEFLVANCDIAFGNFGDSNKAKTVMVNKVVESASMGIPVISQKTTALCEYFQDRNNIFFSEPSSESIAQNVVNLSLNKELQKKISSGSYELYKKQFSKQAYISKISGIL